MDVGGERLGGLGKIVGYNSQPELISGKMVKSAMDEKMCGGGKVNSIRSDYSSRKQRRRALKKGGGSYEDSYKGQDSVYTDNMNKREFGCRQPNWDAKCT